MQRYSQTYARPLARTRVQLEAAPEQLGPFPKTQQAQPAWPGRRTRVAEANAIVPNLQLRKPIDNAEADFDMPRFRVADRVPQRFLRAAVAAGVDHIDTAQYYDVVNDLIREALYP